MTPTRLLQIADNSELLGAKADARDLRAMAEKMSEKGDGIPVAWLYEVFIGEDCWSQKYSDSEITPAKWIRNIRPLYLAPSAAEAQLAIATKALETIASGTRDLVYPFRAMPAGEMRQIASDALRSLKPDGGAK